jgi:hypothetical protein
LASPPPRQASRNTARTFFVAVTAAQAWHLVIERSLRLDSKSEAGSEHKTTTLLIAKSHKKEEFPVEDIMDGFSGIAPRACIYMNSW